MEAIECVSGDAALGQVTLDQEERQLALRRCQPTPVLLERSAVRALLARAPDGRRRCGRSPRRGSRPCRGTRRRSRCEGIANDPIRHVRPASSLLGSIARDAGGAQTVRRRRSGRPPRRDLAAGEIRRREAGLAPASAVRSTARHCGRPPRPPRARCGPRAGRSRGGSTRRSRSHRPSRCGPSSRAPRSAPTIPAFRSTATPAGPRWGSPSTRRPSCTTLRSRQATVVAPRRGRAQPREPPANDLTPAALAVHAAGVSLDHVTVERHGRDWIAAQGMGAFAAVAAGSQRASRN